MPRGDGIVRQGTGKAPGIGQILRQRSAWGSFGGLFCTNYFWYFLLTWLPSYLVRERHFSMNKMAVVGAAAYFAIGVTTRSAAGCRITGLPRAPTPLACARDLPAWG